MQNVNLLNLFLANGSALPWILVGALAVLAIVSSVVCWFLGAKWGKKKAFEGVEWIFEEDDDDEEEDEDETLTQSENTSVIEFDEEMEKLLVKVLRLTVQNGTISLSQIQRRFRVGYTRAGAIVDAMEQRGYVSSFDGEKSRRVLITKEQFEEKYGPIDQEDENETFTQSEVPSSTEVKKEMDKLFVDALKLAVTTGTVSISQLQRCLKIGYARAGAMVDTMENLGYVSSNDGSKARNVLITKEQFEEKYGPIEEN